MFETLQTKPLLGTGIYTIPDIAMILRLPYSKINRWVNTFWNDKFGQRYGAKYSWNVDLSRAVNFYTLIEIYTFYQLSQSGIASKEILNAHELLADKYQTSYPFANSEILKCLRTDGKKVMFEQNDGVIYSIDIHKQTYLNFIKEFYKNLDFGNDSVAVRLWPLGKEKSIVCDPHHQFGLPVISGTNINVETLYELYKAGEAVWFIADLFNLDESKVTDAILFCKKAA
jgi:uncharacterized protein (DUF433 family)